MRILALSNISCIICALGPRIICYSQSIKLFFFPLEDIQSSWDRERAFYDGPPASPDDIAISLHKEAFTDLHLAVPPKTKELTTDLNVQKLVDNYLKPEADDSQSKRSETGMVGLVNLGNTCYMNAVLQALYITRMFSDEVMSVTTNHQQPVLAKLQKTFAYLRLTLRALYSPSDFLKAARPPWFEPGRQQDCSEFLRYLLDTLQEQEKSVKSDVITNFREHKMIVSKSDSASVASEEESVKNSTSDNSVCLDAIVEEDQPEVNGDVEMLSQEGSEDFGSHMSLQTKEEEDEELEDLSGSRNSLSGLKRWTTEENLSSNGGSRSELMEIPLHDSHSNSTGTN